MGGVVLIDSFPWTVELVAEVVVGPLILFNLSVDGGVVKRGSFDLIVNILNNDLPLFHLALVSCALIYEASIGLEHGVVVRTVRPLGSFLELQK